MVMTSFQLEIAAASIALVTTPLLIEVGICVLGNIRRARMPGPACMPDLHLAVIVAAQDREETIAQSVEALHRAGCVFYVPRRADRLAGRPWEIPVFVIAYDCKDSTAAVAAGSGARVIAVNDEKGGGRSLAVRLGFETAQGAGANAFLVVDAGSTISPNLIAATRSALAAGATATQCRVEFIQTVSGAIGTRAFLQLFAASRAMRSRGRAGAGFSAGIQGDGFALTNEILERVPFVEGNPGGFKDYHSRLVAAGFRVHWIDHATVVGTESNEIQERRRPNLQLFVAKMRTTGRLLLALTRGRLRAVEPLVDIFSVPVWMGALLLLAGTRLPIDWIQRLAVGGAVLLAIYGVEAILLGRGHRREATHGGAPALHSLPPGEKERATSSVSNESSIRDQRREVRQR